MTVRELIAELQALPDQDKRAMYPYKYFPDDSNGNLVEFNTEEITYLEVTDTEVRLI